MPAEVCSRRDELRGALRTAILKRTGVVYVGVVASATTRTTTLRNGIAGPRAEMEAFGTGWWSHRVELASFVSRS